MTAATLVPKAKDTAQNPADWTMDDSVDWRSYVQDTRSKYVARYAAFTRLNTNNYSGLEEELANVLNAGEQASVLRADDKVLEMAEWLWSSGGQYLDLRGRAQDGRLLLTRAVNAASRLGDKSRQEQLLGQLGRAWVALGNLQTATQSFEQALTLAREIGDRQGAASHLGNLGQIELEQGNKQQATDYFNEAITIAKAIGDRQMEGRLWASLGLLKMVQHTRTETIEAMAHFREAIHIAKETGDRRGEASHLGSLGRAYELLGINKLSLPPFVNGPYPDDNYDRSTRYSKEVEHANKETYYKSYHYYSDALRIASEVHDLQMEERFLGDRRRVASLGEFPISSDGSVIWNAWARNPPPDGLTSTNHWDLKPHLLAALLPPPQKR